MRYTLVLIAILVLFSLASSEITISKASSIAQKAVQIETQPQSIPDVPILVNGKSYYVIELDNYWVPIDAETGGYSQEFDNDSFSAIALHYFGKNLVTARKGNYITKLSSNLVVLQGNVESKIAFYQTMIPQMPEKLKPQAQCVLSEAESLDSSIKALSDDLDSLGKLEDKMLSTNISWDSYNAWRSKFSKALNDLDKMVESGYSFDEARARFVENATAYVQNESNPLEKRNLVANFISGIAIEGIPSSLPNYKKTKDNWKNWFDTFMSKQVLESRARQIYLDTLDRLAYINARKLKLEAYTKVLSVKTGFEDLASTIGGCLDRLSPAKARKYKEIHDYYNKSLSAYNHGVEMLNSSNYSKAIIDFQNAIGWSEKAMPLLDQMADVKCPVENEIQPTKTWMDTIRDNWMIIVGILFVILVILVFMRGRGKKQEKPKEESLEYYDYGEGYEGEDIGGNIEDMFS